MNILIVGATGVLGKETTRQLLAAGHNVRAMTRDLQKGTPLREMGAEVVQGDLIDPTSLKKACQGVDAVLAAAHQLMGTGQYTSEVVDDAGHRSLIDAAKATEVKHFVYTSAQNASANHPTDFYRTKAKVEAYLKGSGLSYTILRPPAFMEWHVHNLLGASILTTGKTTIYGAGNNPINFVAGSDVARFAVLALTDPRLKNRTIDIGGPDNVSKNQVVKLYEKHSGRTAKVTHVPTGVMKVMGPILRPIQPVISRLMSFSVWADITDQHFDPAAMLKEFPVTLTRVEDFVQDMVSHSKGNALLGK
ncbi:MAG: SDR family oxidoreductase [Anaerolineales bacterium]|nr:SDR family oxidoreductase [Anaerolineales bacterium]